MKTYCVTSEDSNFEEEWTGEADSPLEALKEFMKANQAAILQNVFGVAGDTDGGRAFEGEFLAIYDSPYRDSPHIEALGGKTLQEALEIFVSSCSIKITEGFEVTKDLFKEVK